SRPTRGWLTPPGANGARKLTFSAKGMRSNSFFFKPSKYPVTAARIVVFLSMIMSFCGWLRSGMFGGRLESDGESAEGADGDGFTPVVIAVAAGHVEE